MKHHVTGEKIPRNLSVTMNNYVYGDFNSYSVSRLSKIKKLCSPRSESLGWLHYVHLPIIYNRLRCCRNFFLQAIQIDKKKLKNMTKAL